MDFKKINALREMVWLCKNDMLPDITEQFYRLIDLCRTYEDLTDIDHSPQLLLCREYFEQNNELEAGKLIHSILSEMEATL